MIKFDIDTYLYMLLLGSIVFAYDFNRKTSDYLLIWRKKYARLS